MYRPQVVAELRGRLVSAGGSRWIALSTIVSRLRGMAGLIGAVVGGLRPSPVRSASPLLGGNASLRVSNS